MLNDVETCYFAALIDGLSLINERAQTRKVRRVSLDANALIDYVQTKGQQILTALQIERKAQLAEVLKLDRKARFGRAGLPEKLVQAMIDEYRRTNSLRATARTFGRTRQSMWQILNPRIKLNPVHKILHEAVMYRGRKFTPVNDGYLRLSNATGRKAGEVLLHRIVWIEHNGPIPPGYSLMFRDGNRRNCSIENLELVPVLEVLRRGRRGENAATKLRRLQAAGVSGSELEEALAAFEKRTRGEAQSSRMRNAWASYSPEQRAERIRRCTAARWGKELAKAA
jgi:HNH endonuclease